MICKNCGNYIPNDSQECPICGTNSPKAKVVKVKKRSETKICPECGYKNSYKEFYCKSCNCELYENNEQEIVIDRRKTVAKFILLFLILALVVFIFVIVSEIKVIESSSKPKFNYSHSVNSSSSKSNNTTSPKTTTATTAYEWKLNTKSNGYDWNSVNDVEKDVWCSNSFASWILMGYDIPSNASQKKLKVYLDEFYKDSSTRDVDLVTATEVYAELAGIY